MAGVRYRAKNREKRIETKKNWYKRNKAKSYGYVKKYKQTHKAKVNSYNTKRRLAKTNQMPKWLTIEQLRQIDEIYMQVEILNKTSNIRYSVDHIVPLQGKNVSGLHVPWNLRVLPLSENCSKKNKFNDCKIF